MRFYVSQDIIKSSNFRCDASRLADLNLDKSTIALGNIMDKLNLFLATLLISAAVFLSACEEPEQPYVAGSRPVKTIVVGGTISGDNRTFPAVVDAIQKADISFRVSGKIQKIFYPSKEYLM